MGERTSRQAKIVELVRANNGTTLKELKTRFSVSVVTLRKDLEELEKEGLIVRKFGGAVPALSNDPLESFIVRSRLYEREKQVIGKLAASLIEPMDSVIIDAGSTTLEVLRHLKPGITLTMISPAINIAIEACALQNITVMVPGGGILDHHTLSLEGKAVEDGIACMHADKLFLGVRGVDLIHGLTDTDTRRISLKQVMMRSSRLVIVVADSHKIGKPSLINIAPLDVVFAVVTDDHVAPEVVTEMENRGIQVHIASTAQ